MSESEIRHNNIAKLKGKKFQVWERSKEPRYKGDDVVTIVTTRSELKLDYTGLTGYIISHKDEDVLLYIPVWKYSGLCVAMPFTNVRRL